MVTWEKHVCEIRTGKRKRSTEIEMAVMGGCDPHIAAVVHPPPTVGERMAAELVDQVAQGVVTVTGAQAILGVINRHLSPLLPEDMASDLPTSWYKCKQIATAGTKLLTNVRFFSPCCETMLPVYDVNTRGKKSQCVTCATDVPLSNAVRADYFELSDYVKQLYGSAYTANDLQYGAQAIREMEHSGPLRDRNLRDAWDGKLLEDLLAQNPELRREVLNTLFFALSCDGVEVHKNVSYTPITCKCLNLSPRLRGMLASIWLLGYLPPKVENYQEFLQQVVDMFARNAPGGEPLRVFDASTGQERYDDDDDDDASIV